MGDKVWVQCQVCGHLSQVTSKNASVSEDDLYTNPIWCSSCRDGTKHLRIGANKEDVYWLGNNLLDERFYDYNTK